jgi:hypothetical protein
MAGETPKSVSAFRRAYGAVNPPDKITQEAFDSTPKHLGRLARLKPGDRAEVRDLWDYTQDLLYGGEIQSSLLQFVLPFCLEAWREDLRAISAGYGGFVEYFYPVLANKHVFDLHLKPEQTAAVSDFMRASILEEIDDQRGLSYRGKASRPYRWIRALTTYGVLLPDVERLWNEWWPVDTIGKAVAAVQYISCLMYATNENPVFGPWTPDGGGGPPCLWEFEGHLYANRWLEGNIVFLKKFLSAASAREVLQRSVERLANEPEHEAARGIQGDWPLCEETLVSRCEELPRVLATVSEAGKLFEWTV